MKVIKCENNKVLSVSETATAPGTKDWTVVPDNLDIKAGDDLRFFKNDWSRIPDEELVKKGIRTDNRGVYTNLFNPKDQITVSDFDVAAPEGYGKNLPASTLTVPYQKWDGKKWVEDTERAEKEKALARARADLEDILKNDFVSYVEFLKKGLERIKTAK